MQVLNQRTWGLTALAVALASCATPMAGVSPVGGTTPAAVASGSPSVSATPTPAPAAAPSLPAAPPIAKDARARLTGVVLFNDTPVADASLTAVDLATDKAIALTPWSDVPKGLKLLSTQKTDAKGAFDFELPKLDEGQVVKLVATKGEQTFTALFNNRGQAIGADTPTTASYQLQQGTAISITIRLRLTAATTAATQAFEGALKLTFQLPEGTSAERRSAVLEAARKAAQEVEAALARLPLSAIPGRRGISPSLDKSEVASRLVVTVNGAGAVGQLENFRTAVMNLGVFDSLFRAVQAELLAVAAQKLEARKDLAPIDGSEFPLDQVVISPSGLLGFSGQRAPINLGGAVTSNFVPTPARGGSGGGGSTSSGPEPSGGQRVLRLFSLPTSSYPVALAYLRDRAIGGARLAVADATGSGTLLALSGDQATASGTFGISGLGTSYSVAQARNASGTLYVGTQGTPGNGLKFFEPDGEATDSLETTGQYLALAADAERLYYALYNGTLQPVRWVQHANRDASGVIEVGGSAWSLINVKSIAVFDPRVDGVATSATGTPTIFVATLAGQIFSAHDGASATLATGLGQIDGLAFATPTLYASLFSTKQVVALDVNTLATSAVLTRAQATAVTALNDFIPGGLALDNTATPTYLYVGDTDGSSGRILRVELGILP